jgi:hypothetical protein
MADQPAMTPGGDEAGSRPAITRVTLPPGRRRAPTTTNCPSPICEKTVVAGGWAYEAPGQPGRLWHKRCLYGRQTVRPETGSTVERRVGGRTEAEASTTCNSCGGIIEIGQDIHAIAPNRWAHSGCPRPRR